MGREVYHGDPKGNGSEIKLYDQGVREGAFGLLLNSVRTQIEHQLLVFLDFFFSPFEVNVMILFVEGCR